MPVKMFQTRIKHKIDTNYNFSDFVPLSGEILIGTNSSTNSLDDYYIAKVGDGTTAYQNLPTLGQFPLIGSGFANNQQIINNGTLTLNLSFKENEKKYYIQNINTNNNIDTVYLSIPTDATPMFTEHYVLLINEGNSDILFGGISCSQLYGASTVIYSKQNWIRSGDFCEVSIKIYKLNSKIYIIAIPIFSTGQDYGVVSNEGTWYVNTKINV